MTNTINHYKTYVLASTMICLSVFTHLAIAHEGHHNNSAWNVCEDKAQGEPCSYVMQTNKRYKGSCLQIAEALMCVRNQPIENIDEKHLSNEHTDKTSWFDLLKIKELPNQNATKTDVNN